MREQAGVRIKITLLATGSVFILLVLTMFASNTVIIFAIRHDPVFFYEPFPLTSASHADPGNPRQRLSELSATVLSLSKVESLTLLTDKTAYSLSEQIRESILLLESKWEKKRISFDINLEEVIIRADGPLLKQVWMNLLDNAIKFSPAEECITVALRSDNRNAVVSVKDHGIGMADNTQRFIFDKFYQGDTSHHMEGNGLGLPLVKRILELHKGTVAVKSQAGRGSTFIVRLPLDGQPTD